MHPRYQSHQSSRPTRTTNPTEMPVNLHQRPIQASEPPDEDLQSATTLPENVSIEKGRVIVVKIGTSSLMREATTDDSSTVSATAGRMLPKGEGELAVSTLALLVDTLLALRRDNFRVVLVSSGAVGVGCRELGVIQRPKPTPNCTPAERAAIMAKIQAYAAVGQSVLMRTYDRFMRMAHQPIAQVLLTSSDIGSEYQYRNARNTILELLDMGVIPIVNENDTVATEELKYGDNDWLSALVSTAIDADWLFLLTDVDQLCTGNPRTNPDAVPISVVPDINNMNVDFSSKATGTQWGTGGMNTKITAARLATSAGVRVGMIHGRHPDRVLDFVHDKPKRIGTVFEPHQKPMSGDRHRWISHCLPPKGDIHISAQAAESLRISGGRHLVRAAGVESCTGNFPANSAVRVLLDGVEMARGMCNFSATDLMCYAGKTGSEITKMRGEPADDIVINSQNLAVLVREHDRANGVAK